MKKPIELIKKLLKNKELIMYLVFGVLTTLISFGTYELFILLNIHELLSNLMANIIAILFAYITNKLFVFESKSFAPKILFPEMLKFFSSRAATFFLEEGILAVAVTWPKTDFGFIYKTFWKLVATAIVIVLNFIISKLLVFKKDKK